jgi:hypothetical protein
VTDGLWPTFADAIPSNGALSDYRVQQHPRIERSRVLDHSASGLSPSFWPDREGEHDASAGDRNGCPAIRRHWICAPAPKSAGSRRQLTWTRAALLRCYPTCANPPAAAARSPAAARDHLGHPVSTAASLNVATCSTRAGDALRDSLVLCLLPDRAD